MSLDERLRTCVDCGTRWFAVSTVGCPACGDRRAIREEVALLLEQGCGITLCEGDRVRPEAVQEVVNMALRVMAKRVRDGSTPIRAAALDQIQQQAADGQVVATFSRGPLTEQERRRIAFEVAAELGWHTQESCECVGTPTPDRTTPEAP